MLNFKPGGCLPGDFSDSELFLKLDVGQDDDRIGLDQVLVQRLAHEVDGDVAVQICQLWAANFSPISSNIGFGEVEVGRQVRDLDSLGVVEGDRLDSPENDVLRDFGPEALQPRDEDVRDGHLRHGLVAQDVELS